MKTKKVTPYLGKSACMFSILAFIVFLGAGKMSDAQNCPVGNVFFEIDGNAVTNTLTMDDWDRIYSGTSHTEVTTGILNDLPSNADNHFTQGSKDLNDVSTWRWSINSVPDKDDLLHGGTALYNNDMLFFFGDRYATNGDAQIGFWYFQDKVGPLPNGSFSGHHIVGDILLESNFVNGGGVSQIMAYEWVGSGGDHGALQTLTVNGTNMCAVTNSTPQPSPWPYTPKFGSANIFPAGGFFEGGLDLTALGLTTNPCFSSFLLETRASQSLSAELKDFIGGSFLMSPTVTVNSASYCVSGSATLTATVVGGVAPFTYLWSNGATTSSITVSPSVTTTYTVVVTAANGCISNTVSGTVTVNSLPICNISNTIPGNIICNHGNYTVSSTTSASGYSWSMSVDGNPSGWAIIGSDTAQTITFSAGDCGTAGFLVHFTLTLTNGPGCSSTCDRTFAPGAPACNVSIRLPVILTCTSISQYLLTSYATDIINPTFEWTRNGLSIGAGINNGTGLDSILISLPGTYRFTLTDPADSANTCFDEVIVTQNIIPPGVVAGGCTLNCIITSMALFASSPTSGVTYSWTGPNGFTSTQQDPIVSVPGTYTVTATDSVNGCTSTAQATININNTPPPCNIGTVSPANLICNHGNYTISTSLDTALYNLFWSMTVDGNPPGWAIIGSNATDTITFSAGNCGSAGFLVHFTLTVTDRTNGCTNTCSRTFAPGAPACNVSIRPPVELTCTTTSQYLLTSYATDIINPTFDWTRNGVSIGAGINNGTGLDSILISLPGTYRFTLTDPADSSNTCFDEVIVTQNITPPGATAVGCILNCIITSAQIGATSPTSGVTYSWSGPNGFTSTLQNPMVSNAGTYTVTVTNPVNGCTSTATAVVTQNITPPNASATVGTLTCTVLSVQINASSLTSGVTFSWSGPNSFTSTLQNPTVSNAGTYTVTVTNPVNGCTSTATAVVTQNITPPGASATGGTLTCTTVSVQISASSLTGGVTFSWSGPNSFTSTLQNPTVSNAGTYTVTVTNPVNGCTSTATAVVTQNITAPGASATGGTLTCMTVSVQISVSSLTSGVTFSWSGPNSFTSTLQNPTVSNAGTYTVTVTNPVNGCTSTATAVVTQNITPPGASATGGTLTCTTVSVQISASSLTGGVTFSWSGPNSFTSTLQNPTVSNAGTYTVTVTNPVNGCTSTATAVVTQNITPPGASATGGTLTCTTVSVQISASSLTGGVTFSWSGPNSFTSTLQNPTVSNAGTYTVTVTNPVNGCTSTATAVVTQNITPPGATATGGTLTCTTISVQISASSLTSGVTFSWSGPNSFTSTLQNPTVSNAGTYTVTVTNPVNGCTSTATAVVTQNITPPGASATGGTLTCTTVSVQISASSLTGGVTFSWSGPNSFTSILQNPTVSNAGTYTVTVTNPVNGCTSTATAVVTQNITPPGATATGGTLTCTVLSVQINASSLTSGVTFSWSGPNSFTSILQNPTVSNAGTYTVTVTNPVNGCTSTATAVVTQNITAPGASATGGTLTCMTVSVQISVSSLTSGVTFSWSGPNSFTSTMQNPTVSNVGTYTVTVTNPVNGCTSTATAVVTQNITAPGASATGGTLTCMTVSVQISVSSLTSGVTFSWSGPNSFTSTLQNPTVSNAGTYTVTVTNPVNGCTSTATAVVTQNITPPGASATGGTLTCTTVSVQISASSLTGGVTFSWSGPNSFTSTLQNPTVSNAGTYTVTVTNPVNGCTSTATAVVTQNITAPGASATGGTLTCMTVSVQISVSSLTSGVTFSWSGPNSFTSTLQNPTVSNAGTYTVTVTNPVNGCTSTATAVVTQNITPPGASATGGTLTCTTVSVQISASSLTGGVTFSWSGPNSFTSTLQNPTVSNAGTYTVTVTNPVNGCTSTATAVVTQNITAPGASATGGTLTCMTVSVQISVSSLTSGVTFSWSGPNSFTSTLQNPTVSNAGTYTVTVTNPVNGCTSTATAVVTQNITPPGATATGGTLTCTTISVQISASSLTSGVTFSWSGPNSFTSTVQNPTVGMAGTYTVTVTNPANGCTSTAQAVVSQNITPPNASATGGTLTCTVTSLQINASSTTGGVTYSWSGPNSFTSTMQNPTVSNVGTYTVTVTNPVNGCSGTAQAVVGLNIIHPTVNAGPDKVLNCTVTSVTITATASAGTTLLWSPGGQTTSSITASSAGTYIVTATNTVNGCTATDTVAVTSDTIPPNCMIGCNCGESLCQGRSESICAISGYSSYVWSTGATTTCITIITGGTYSITITKSNGCTSSCNKTFTVRPNPTCDISGLDSICDGGSASYCAPAGNASYVWSNGAFSSCITLYDAGTVSVTITDTLGCSSTCNKTLAVNQLPSCSITGNLIICTNQSTTLCADSGTISGDAYLWSTGATTQCITTDTIGNYYVTVTNSNGCTSSCTACVVLGACMLTHDGIAGGAYPNPFSSQATVEFMLNNFSAQASVDIYNLSGAKVANIFNENAEQGVLYKAIFSGDQYPNGTYFYRITAGDHTYYDKLILSK